MKKIIISAVIILLSLALNAQSKAKVKDFQLIQNAVNSWTQTQDDKNLNSFMELWSDNGIYFKNPFGEFKTKEELKAFEKNYLSGFAKGKRHLLNNIHIKSSNKHLTKVTVDFMMVEVDEIPFIVATVRADVIMVKESKEWKFKSIVLQVDKGFGKLMESKKQ